MGMVDVRSQLERMRNVSAVRTDLAVLYRLEDLKAALHVPNSENRRVSWLIRGHYVLRQRRINSWTRCSERWVDLHGADAVICQYARESASALLQALRDIEPEVCTGPPPRG